LKRGWYLKNNPKAKMYFAKNPEFWKTETGVGLKWEKYAAKLLKAKHLIFKRGADLIWKEKMVDVKVCNLYRRKLKRGKPVKSTQTGVWVFNRNKVKPMDFFLCIALFKNKPEKIFLIPNSEFPQKGMVVGKKSKYDKYLIQIARKSKR